MRLPSIAQVCAGAAVVASLAAPAAALHRRVEIINDTDFDIIEFYGSNTDTDDWEEDILGDSILPTGESVRINFDDGTGYCVLDFRAVFDDGDVLVRRKINIWKIGTYTYHE